METASAEQPAGEFNLAEGDFDPVLKKTVTALIQEEEDFIVYLDVDDPVQWRGVVRNSSGAPGVPNQVGHLEALSMPLGRTPCLQPVRRLLGESVARLFSQEDAKPAREIPRAPLSDWTRLPRASRTLNRLRRRGTSPGLAYSGVSP